MQCQQIILKHDGAEVFIQFVCINTHVALFDSAYNVRVVKKDTKRSSVLLLRLVSFFMTRTLLLICN